MVDKDKRIKALRNALLDAVDRLEAADERALHLSAIQGFRELLRVTETENK